MRVIAFIFAGLSIAVLTCVLALKLFQKQYEKRLAREWTQLEIAGSGEFDPRQLASLPAPVVRYLTRSIATGTRLYGSADVEYGGTITTGVGAPAQPYSATLRLAPPFGFARKVKLSQEDVTGSETLVGGEGLTRFARGGYIPGVEQGEDITKVHRAELALLHVMLPTRLLPNPSVVWTPLDDARAVAQLTLDGERHDLTIEVDADGKLLRASVNTRVRYAQREARRDAAFVLIPTAERSTGGLTIPGDYTLHFENEKHGSVPFAHPIVLDVQLR